jgi:4-hydroxy-2-oxoglutarate aldolase
MPPHNDAPNSESNGSSIIASTPLPNGSALRSDFYTNSNLSSSASSISQTISARPLLPGVYVPNLCFFDPLTEDVDTATISHHTQRMAASGVVGVVTQGSNGESVHLTHEERALVTSTTRSALDAKGYTHIPVIVGCGAQSTRETIQYCREAHAAGGDYALVLPPNYYAGSFQPNSATLVNFFTAVADASPIPLLLYNYPGAVAGMDMSSDLIIELAAHANIIGVKLTCGNTGKLNRIVSATRTLKPRFLVLGGSADFLLQTLVCRGHGTIAGLANISPRAMVELVRRYDTGDLQGAQDLQEVLARADWSAIKAGVEGAKSVLDRAFGYGGVPRSPLAGPRDEKRVAAWRDEFVEALSVEKTF